MQQDKMIIKALKEEIISSLPPDFNERAILRIYKEADRKRKQNFFLMLGCTSMVSLGLIVMAIYLLKKYLSFNFAFHFQLPSLKLGSLSQYYFDIYIAILMIVLIYIDYLFRSFWNKKKYGKGIGQ